MKIIVTGTDTAVGKTYICILLGKYLERKNIDFLIYKPFATGTIITDTGKKEIEDIYLYKKYLNLQLNKNLFVYKTFNFPNAPTIASQLDKKKLDDRDFSSSLQLYKHLSRKNDNILIEGIGGLLVPITFNKLFLDFIKILNLPVFLVTTNKLGTINHTLLSIHILKENNIKFKIIFNKLDIKKSDRENKAVLKDITRFGKIDNIIQIPFIRPEKLRYSKFCCKVSPAIFNF